MKKTTIIVISVIVSIIIILGVAMLILYSMITNRENEEKLNANSSTEIISILAKSVINGTKAEITNQQINGIIKHSFEKNSAVIDTTSDITVNAVTVYFDNKDTHLYVDANYKGIDIIFTATTQISLDSENKSISFDIIETKAGSLSIPSKWLINSLKSNKELKNFSQYITITDKSIVIPAEYPLTFEGFEFNLEILNTTTQAGSVILETNSIKDQVTDYLGDFISGILG